MVDAPNASDQLDDPGTWQQFRAWFPDERSCVAYLERLRWPTGFRCPGCAGEKGWRLDDGFWACSVCLALVNKPVSTVRLQLICEGLVFGKGG
ncbi:MAG: transposase [Acidobacteriaceae bacterium]